MADNHLPFGKVETTEELGRLCRQHRKKKKLTLEKAASVANLSVRFLSEFERGKETAEVGKVLKALQSLGLELEVGPGDRDAAGQGRQPP